MHWVLQNNIFNEEAYDRLKDTLERFSISYSVHKIVPFMKRLEPDIDVSSRVICMGSYEMRRIAAVKGWHPGVFDISDQTFEVQMKYWGDNMLNADSRVMKLSDINLSDIAFIRPIDDTKSFSGRLFDPNEFQKWMTNIDANGSSVTGDLLVQISTPKKIYREVRYWIVKGEIATSSAYKIGKRVVYVEHNEPQMDDYVKQMVNIWQPADAFVIDICETDAGYRIVEPNTINSSGLYAADTQRLVMALHDGFSHD